MKQDQNGSPSQLEAFIQVLETIKNRYVFNQGTVEILKYHALHFNFHQVLKCFADGHGCAQIQGFKFRSDEFSPEGEKDIKKVAEQVPEHQKTVVGVSPGGKFSHDISKRKPEKKQKGIFNPRIHLKISQGF
jgi:hypothetical protein